MEHRYEAHNLTINNNRKGDDMPNNNQHQIPLPASFWLFIGALCTIIAGLVIAVIVLFFRVESVEREVHANGKEIIRLGGKR